MTELTAHSGEGETSVPFAEKKRFIQSEIRRIRNHASKSRVNTLVKKVSAAIESGDGTAEIRLREAISTIQRAGQKKVLHPNTASRRIAQLSKMVRRSKTTDTPAES